MPDAQFPIQLIDSILLIRLSDVLLQTKSLVLEFIIVMEMGRCPSG